MNTLPSNTRIHKLILVSCNSDYQPNRNDSDAFYNAPLNYEDIKQKCPSISIIHSEDDPYVPIAAGEQLATNLNATFVQYKTAGHFGSKKQTAPDILREVIGEKKLNNTPIRLNAIPALQNIVVRDQLTLRPLRQSDDMAILSILDRDPSIRKRVSIASRFHSTSDIAKEIKNISSGHGLIRYVLLNDKKPIGMINFWRDDGFWGVKHPDDYGFGYFLDPNERGKGLIGQAVTKIMEIAKTHFFVNQFVAFCEDTNRDSIAVLNKLGFQPTDIVFTEPKNGWVERKYINTRILLYS